jgi:hypothetical protein
MQEDLERRLDTMEGTLKKVSEHQDINSKQMLLVRLHLKRNNDYSKSIHQHFMGTKRGRKGLFQRVRTLEVRQKGIIGTLMASLSAAIVGAFRAIF